MSQTTAVVQPDQSFPKRNRTYRWLAFGLPVALTALAVILGRTTLVDWVQRLEGHVLSVSEQAKRARVGKAGESTSVAFPLRNISAQTVTVYGAETDCDCLTATALPLVIPPGETREIVLRFQTDAKETRFNLEHKAQLLIDCPSPPVLLTTVVQIVPVGDRPEP
jgi:hypothetical protein